MGWLNWGFYDHPQARDVTQLTGLLTSDGRLKAWGQEFQRLATRNTAAPGRRGLVVRPELDWDACVTSVAAGNEFRNRYVKAFIDSQ